MAYINPVASTSNVGCVQVGAGLDVTVGGIVSVTAGSSGFAGSRGFTGSQGTTGFTGSQGVVGFTGSQGTTGFTGSQGVVGFTGSQGVVGFTGSQGVVGFTGSQGDIGFTGSQGDIGFTGSQGDIGFTGSQGDIGFTGSQGITPAFTYGYFYDTTLQSNPIVDTANPTTFNVTGDTLGVTLAAGSRVTVSKTSVYNIVFTVSISKTDLGIDTISIWLELNGTPLASSRQDQVLDGNINTLFSSGAYLLNLTAGDFIEIFWSSADIGMELLSTGPDINPTRPSIPSARISITET